MSDVLLIDTSHPQVTVLTLDCPEKRNALSLQLIDRLHDAVRQASDDRNCRAVILRGNGPAFCAGLDLQEAAEADFAQRSGESLARLYEAITSSPLVTIAAAQGAAYGGGAGLVLAVDLVVASEDLKIGFPEVRRGLVAALVTCLLRRHVGDRIARELILLGENLPVARALTLGLVNRVVARDQIEAGALGLAAEVSAGAPGALARSKRLLDDLGLRPIAADLRRALVYHLEARHSAEAAEGIAAFLERRDPHWAPRFDESADGIKPGSA